MRRNKYFTHICISGDDYILPIAQSISDHKRGIRINKTGLLLWKLLEHGTGRDALINDFITKAGIQPEKEAEAATDAAAFLDHLIRLGIISDVKEVLHPEKSENEMTDSELINYAQAKKELSAFEYSDFNTPEIQSALKLNIAGIRIDLYGKKELFDPSFYDFSCRDIKVYDTAFPDMKIFISAVPNVHKTHPTKYIIKNDEMNISETESEYIVSYPENSQVIETRISKDARIVRIFITDDYTVTNPADTNSIIYQLFHAIRIPFLYIAEKKGLYAIHSASILYKDKAFLFSASSGIGKSTHAALWTKYTDAVNINGDLNLIGLSDGKATVFGIPWCGTSGIYDTHSYPLGGIVFLKRSENDMVENINGSDRLFTLTRRTISPLWNSAMLKKMICDLTPLEEQIYIKRLYCTKEPSAQRVLQQSIDDVSPR